MGTRGTDLPTAVSQTTVEGEHTDAPWGQDPDIRSALEGTATDQARAMAVSAMGRLGAVVLLRCALNTFRRSRPSSYEGCEERYIPPKRVLVASGARNCFLCLGE